MLLELLYWIDHIWSSKECVCCACDPSERLDAASTTVHKDCPHDHDGGLLIFIHRLITSKQPSSPESLSDLHMEELTINAEIGNTKFSTSTFLQSSLAVMGINLQYNIF